MEELLIAFKTRLLLFLVHACTSILSIGGFCATRASIFLAPSLLATSSAPPGRVLHTRQLIVRWEIWLSRMIY